MDTLTPLVGGRADIWLADAYAFDIAVIGGQYYFKVAIKQGIENAPKRSPPGPMPYSSMHAIGAINDTVQHLIDRPDHDACDPAARFVELLTDSGNVGVVVL
jgi:hypothetical protein